MEIKFFKSPVDFRKWLEKHHEAARELWVGFYKKDSGRASITWPESVDEALCFGWIDGIRTRASIKPDERSLKRDILRRARSSGRSPLTCLYRRFVCAASIPLLVLPFEGYVGNPYSHPRV